MARLGAALGHRRLFIKRDDAISFGFGGNKVRKLEFLAAEAMARGADTLVTVGGLQSNHARVTAAVAARMGVDCLLLVNGNQPARLSANALLDELLGAEVQYIASREERTSAIAAAVERLRRAGRTPYAIPIGASVPLGACGFVRAIGEMLAQGLAPDVIVHASSSGGTQAGLLAGCALHGLSTRVIGVSVDDPSADIEANVRQIIVGVGSLVGVDGDALAAACPIVVEDGHVGDGYGLATPASREAQRMAAGREALFVDHTYTAKALGALIAWVRDGRFDEGQTVLFWHTGGQTNLFA